MRRIMVVLLLLAGPAHGQDWAPLTGPEIEALLTDATVSYGTARQRFFPSGRTLYNAGRDSWGYWSVRGDQYCSNWPPADRWDCYDMTASGEAVRFIDANGGITEGTRSR